MRRALSAIVALLLAIWSALVVRWTNGVPVLWTLLLIACPTVCVSDEPAPFPPGGILKVMGRAGMGHGCAVREDVILTARHVVNAGQPDFWGPPPVVWSDVGGAEGRADVWRQDVARDLAALKVTTGKPSVVFPIARAGPKEGDTVYIVGYSMGTSNPIKPRVVAAKVLGTSAGHLFYSKTPSFGSSGACVLFNREVVAINIAMFSEAGPGFGVAVWGDWAPDLKEEAQ